MDRGENERFSSIPRIERLALFRRALINSLPVLMGYLTMGCGAGILMAVKGDVPCPAFWAGLFAISCISGTLSYAIVPALAASVGLWQIAVLTLAINFRYAFYGFSMLSRWRHIPLGQKFWLIFTLADEIYALAVACKVKNPLKNRYYCLWNGTLNASYWLVGTTIGGLIGSNFSIPSKGIEFAMVSLFLVIFTDQMKDFVAQARRARAKEESHQNASDVGQKEVING